jgi:hypothetical protein
MNAGRSRFTHWRPKFIEVLSNSANVRAACRAAGVDRATAYRHRERNAAFAQEWAQALQEAGEVLEAVAWQRAKEKSDLLLIFLLKALNPEKYRETIVQQHQGPDGGPIQHESRTVSELDREINRLLAEFDPGEEEPAVRHADRLPPGFGEPV